jgi:hypothetical protein
VTNKFALLALSISLVAIPALAAETCPAPEDLSPVTDARPFTQTRNLEGVARPLVSEGHVATTEKEVFWTVTTPIEITTRISEDGIYQSVMGGPEEAVQAGSASNPMISQSGLIDLLQGRFDVADEAYAVERTTPETGDWTLVLTPKEEAMAPYLKTIMLTGCEDIRTITVSQPNGDDMRVEFGAG